MKRRRSKVLPAVTMTLLRGIVHKTGIAAIVSAKSWASVASSDDDDELLHSFGSTSLAKRKC